MIKNPVDAHRRTTTGGNGFDGGLKIGQGIPPAKKPISLWQDGFLYGGIACH